jgi:hypothetical protein
MSTIGEEREPAHSSGAAQNGGALPADLLTPATTLVTIDP